VLGHALYMRAIHGAKARNDTIDAAKIAALLTGGLLPQAYAYPANRDGVAEGFEDASVTNSLEADVALIDRSLIAMFEISLAAAGREVLDPSEANTARRQAARPDFSATAKTRPRTPLSGRQTACLVQGFVIRRRLGLTARTRLLIDEQSRRFSPSRPRFSRRRAILPEFPH
jgi:hypothetical protein